MPSTPGPYYDSPEPGNRQAYVDQVSAQFVDTAEVALAVHHKLIVSGIDTDTANAVLVNIINQFAHSATH